MARKILRNATSAGAPENFLARRAQIHRDKYLSVVYIFYMGTVLPNLGSRVEFLVAQSSATRKFEGKLKPESFVKPERKVFITGLAWDNSHNM